MRRTLRKSKVNLIGSARDTQLALDQEVSKLYDLEGLGVRDSQDEVYEGFKENISFNGGKVVCKVALEGGSF